MKIEIDYEKWRAAQYFLGYAGASATILLERADRETDFAEFTREAVRLAEKVNEQAERAHRIMYPKLHEKEEQNDGMESAAGGERG